MRIALATRSAHKADEIREILGPMLPAELVSLDALGIEPAAEEDDVECFDSFRANALAKARYFVQRTGLITIADDSGIAVDALYGAPGVRSKRFAGDHARDDGDTDAANNRLLLDKLAGQPEAQRSAYYACAAALVTPSGRTLCTVGVLRGRIAEEPRGSHGFGYDPLMLLPDLGRTCAEIDPALKNRRSHRARAFRALAATASGLLGRPAGH